MMFSEHITIQFTYPDTLPRGRGGFFHLVYRRSADTRDGRKHPSLHETHVKRRASCGSILNITGRNIEVGSLCFAGTRLLTLNGYIPVQALKQH